MNNTCVILLLFFAFASCTLSSYLDIPPPPERPMRFKTKEQIENYLKSVKDYYDAFKIKLVRRENSISDFYTNLDKRTNDDDNNNEDSNEDSYLFKKYYYQNLKKYQANTLRRLQENNLI